MILIEDLGTKRSGKCTKRYGIFMCESCNNKYERRFDNVRKYCIHCSRKLNVKSHNESKTRLYGIWGSMKYRGTSNNVKGYENISICDEWKDYLVFKDWAMSNGYKEDLSIDRIDNSGDYEPSNCRWTNYYIQNQNKRKIVSTNTSGYRGVYGYKDRDYYYASIRHNGKKVNLGRFYDKIEAAKAYDGYVIDNGLNSPLNFQVRKNNGV